jgi:chorismate mutase
MIMHINSLRVKYEYHLPMHNAARECEIIKRVGDLARQVGANPEMVEKIYRLIMDDSKIAQKEEYDRLTV